MATGVLFSEEIEDETSEAVKANRKKSVSLLEERKKNHGDDANYFIAPGVIANKQEKTVMLDAFTTSVAPGDIAEFFIIGEHSGNSYEALFFAFALPSDICRAIEFIGLSKGRSVDYKNLIFWSKGERVNGVAIKENTSDKIPLESFVYDAKTKSLLQQTGFVFTADGWKDNAFIGDEVGPISIISSYNESLSVLDTSGKAMQSDVYERYVVSTNFTRGRDVWYTIVLTPEKRPKGKPLRVVDYKLSFKKSDVEGSTSNVVCSGSYKTQQSQEKEDFKNESLSTAINNMRKFLPEQDVFASVDWSEDLTIREIKTVCTMLKMIDADNAIRIEPPVSGHLYYKAFLPNDDWRDRTKRFSQPCALRFHKKDDGSYGANLEIIEEIWGDSSLDPELKISVSENITPEALPKLLKTHTPNLNVLLIFAPRDMLYKNVVPYTKSIFDTHKNIHVFEE